MTSGSHGAKERVMHLVPAGPLWKTACGLSVETPDHPWRSGLVPDTEWTGPLGEITCRNCIGTLTYPESAVAREYAE